MMDKIKKNAPADWKTLPGYNQPNRKWLKKSGDIILRVIEIMQERGISQSELAKMIEVTRQQVSKWTRGQENLTLDTICKLEEAFGVELITIVTDNVEKHGEQVVMPETVEEVEPKELINEKTVISFGAFLTEKKEFYDLYQEPIVFKKKSHSYEESNV